MKVEVVKHVPQPVPPDYVNVSIPLHVAQMIVVSMGRNHTAGLSNKQHREDHYDFFNMLLDKVGRGNFACEMRGTDNYIGAYLVERE